MGDDIDDIADSLGAVKAGEELTELPVTTVEDDGQTVTLHLKTPAGNVFDREFKRPPVWGANCDLKRLVDGLGVDHDSIETLEGESLPVRREVVEGRPRFELDFERITAESV